MNAGRTPWRHGRRFGSYGPRDVERQFRNNYTVGKGRWLPNAAGHVFSQSDLQASAVQDIAMNVVRGLGLRYDIVTAAGDISFFLHPAR